MSGFARLDSLSGLFVSECFVSLQGEGVTAGQPAAFVRLARCNLACSWCDTPYSWDFERYSFDEEVSKRSVEDLAGWVVAADTGRLVLTGGEPLIQQKVLVKLVQAIDARTPERRWAVEIETNGTVPPHPALLERVDQWNVSPKLAGSGEPRERRLRFDVLTKLQATGRAFFKFVLSSEADRREVSSLCAELSLDRPWVSYMPEARSAEEWAERSPAVAQWALDDRVGFSPRLHLLLYGGRRGH